MTREINYINVEEEITIKMPRSQKMIEWIVRNSHLVDSYKSGNVTFSFTDGTCKVKVENFEVIS